MVRQGSVEKSYPKDIHWEALSLCGFPGAGQNSRERGLTELSVLLVGWSKLIQAVLWRFWGSTDIPTKYPFTPLV